MQRKLTISIDEAVYEGLHREVGRGHISHFLQELARPHVIRDDVEAAYREMAADSSRESAALEWVEALVGDVVSPSR